MSEWELSRCYFRSPAGRYKFLRVDNLTLWHLNESKESSSQIYVDIQSIFKYKNSSSLSPLRAFWSLSNFSMLFIFSRKQLNSFIGPSVLGVLISFMLLSLSSYNICAHKLYCTSAAKENGNNLSAQLIQISPIVSTHDDDDTQLFFVVAELLHVIQTLADYAPSLWCFAYIILAIYWILPYNAMQRQWRWHHVIFTDTQRKKSNNKSNSEEL